MKTLLIATSNPGKLAEIKLFLGDLPVALVGLADVGIGKNADETGDSFRENAVIKARYCALKSGLPTIADDGGLEIDALGGEPGVRSHRWIHRDRDDDDEELIAYTMEKMKNIPQNMRQAQLRVVLALVLPDKRVFTAEAKIRGVIPTKASASRTKGFPYRSILYLPAIDKFYNQDELTSQENERYNHRKKALDRLKPIIRTYVC